MATCGICFEAYDAEERPPLLVPCGHTVCGECVAQLDACPFCRLRLPANRALPRNFALLEVMDAEQQSEGAEERLLRRYCVLPPSPASGEHAAAGEAAGMPSALVLPAEDLQLTTEDLGVGGTGRVVLGYLRGREVAVKLLPLSSCPPAAREALQREVQLLARVSASCRHTVKLLGISVKEGRLALVMRRYPTSLAQHMAKQEGGSLDPGSALLMAQDLLRGLAELHTHGVVMADLKPDNVLLDESGAPLLCDFGLGRAVSTTIGQHAGQITSPAGSINFMAPEQFAMLEGDTLTPQSDVWGFGCTLLHMLTGRPPWGGLNIGQVTMQVGVHRRTPQLPAGLSPTLRELLGDCLRPDPHDRPSAAVALSRLVQELHRQLRGLMSTSGGEAPASAELSRERLPAAQAPRPPSPPVVVAAPLAQLSRGQQQQPAPTPFTPSQQAAQQPQQPQPLLVQPPPPAPPHHHQPLQSALQQPPLQPPALQQPALQQPALQQPLLQVVEPQSPPPPLAFGSPLPPQPLTLPQLPEPLQPPPQPVQPSRQAAVVAPQPSTLLSARELYLQVQSVRQMHAQQGQQLPGPPTTPHQQSPQQPPTAVAQRYQQAQAPPAGQPAAAATISPLLALLATATAERAAAPPMQPAPAVLAPPTQSARAAASAAMPPPQLVVAPAVPPVASTAPLQAAATPLLQQLADSVSSLPAAAAPFDQPSPPTTAQQAPQEPLQQPTRQPPPPPPPPPPPRHAPPPAAQAPPTPPAEEEWPSLSETATRRQPTRDQPPGVQPQTRETQQQQRWADLHNSGCLPLKVHLASQATLHYQRQELATVMMPVEACELAAEAGNQALWRVRARLKLDTLLHELHGPLARSLPRPCRRYLLQTTSYPGQGQAAELWSQPWQDGPQLEFGLVELTEEDMRGLAGMPLDTIVAIKVGQTEIQPRKLFVLDTRTPKLRVPVVLHGHTNLAVRVEDVEVDATMSTTELGEAAAAMLPPQYQHLGGFQPLLLGRHRLRPMPYLLGAVARLGLVPGGECHMRGYGLALQSGAKVITVKIKTLAGAILDLQAFADTTVGGIKAQIEDLKGVPAVNGQLLFYKGVMLENGQTLADCGIEDGSTVHIVI